MAKGIVIKKPDHVAEAKPILEPLEQNQAPLLSPILYLMLIVSFPAALVAFYFFIQTRSA